MLQFLFALVTISFHPFFFLAGVHDEGHASNDQNVEMKRGNVTHRLGRGALSSGANVNNNNRLDNGGAMSAVAGPNSLVDKAAYGGGGRGGKEPPPALLSDDVSVPSVYHYLPHLLNYGDALVPAFKLSKDRSRGTSRKTLK